MWPINITVAVIIGWLIFFDFFRLVTFYFNILDGDLSLSVWACLSSLISIVVFCGVVIFGAVLTRTPWLFLHRPTLYSFLSLQSVFLNLAPRGTKLRKRKPQNEKAMPP